MEPINQLIKSYKPTIDRNDRKQSHQDSYQCNDCKDTGYILEGSGLDMFARICNCQKRKNIERKVKSARLSKLLRTCTFDKFDYRFYAKTQIKENQLTYRDLAEKAMEASACFVYNIIENRTSDSLLFVGKTGRGKTYLAGAIANEILEQKPSTQLLFVVVPDLLNEIRSSYGKNTDSSEFEIMDAARSSEVLILDDLGAHNYSDWVKDKLYSIIDYRLQEQLPTVITTNLLDPPAMDLVLGERITSRIFQLCSVYRLMCERDIRLVRSHEDMLNVFAKNENNKD
ncbi:hypothetical protein BHU72_08235 [Desulfuribacillus stibiiarsenatis]|uniref:AAA+ ATPase domain-containing protein n=1 Tax=Desulfuribacillus stibiiarsenatis TaxID=1390249 RepID=A0A1E5L3U9_9FIRM|nr:ATP-binding protein [Desulfuribacillus stibiiarsenatis]OEH84812.1 hypothetical protein BHU72_08235 [Desulfuribacillus stibiiarsenatis]